MKRRAHVSEPGKKINFRRILIMVKATKKVPVGNIIMIMALMLIVFNGAMVRVNAGQTLKSYNFVFDNEGDTDATARAYKWYSGTDAYIECTSAESDSATFEATFYFWNSDDGTQHNNFFNTLWAGQYRDVPNGAAADDEAWFEAELINCGMTYDEGGIFWGNWTPDK